MQKETRIALVGMMGSGKSSTARALAAKCGATWADTDDSVRELCGLTPAQMIEQQGEQAFRAVERRALLQVLRTSARVLATGGGIILRADNRRTLRRRAVVVYLQADAKLLWQRVLAQKAATRPLLKAGEASGAAHLQNLLAARQVHYERVAHCVIPQQSGDTPQQVAEKILAAVATLPAKPASS